jgi:hypothetical protein
MGDLGVALRKDADDDEHSLERSPLFFDPWLICDHPRIDALVHQAVQRGEEALISRLKKKASERIPRGVPLTV